MQARMFRFICGKKETYILSSTVAVEAEEKLPGYLFKLLSVRGCKSDIDIGMGKMMMRCTQEENFFQNRPRGNICVCIYITSPRGKQVIRAFSKKKSLCILCLRGSSSTWIDMDEYDSFAAGEEVLSGPFESVLASFILVYSNCN